MGSYTMKNITVHKEGEEGTILVDGASGKIITPLDQQPEWTNGLATCLVQERLSFYEKRFGAESDAFKTIMNADAVEFSDLGWMGMSVEGGDEIELFADPAYRSEVVAKALGIDTETGEMSGKVLAEREVSRENRGRTQTEIETLEHSQDKGFQPQQSTREEAIKERTGTAHR